MKKNLLVGFYIFTLAALVACQNPQPSTATSTPSAGIAPLISSGNDVAPCVNPGASYPAAGYPAAADCLTAGASAAYPGAQPVPADPVAEEWHAEVLPPQAGQATVTGVVLAEKSQNPVVNAPVFLAEVYYQGDSGAFVLDGAFSPQSVTDSDGRFAIVDIPAGDYVLVIGNPEVNDYAIIEDETGKARVWTADPDNILDMAVIEVELQLWQ
jgi:hypothetical protein